jgi:pimeloyl-ACP methyl ester carboxylesterase
MAHRREVLGTIAASVAATVAAKPTTGDDPMEQPGVEERRRELMGLLGDLPPRHREIGVRRLAVEERPGFVLERLEMDLNGLELVPAYFVRPAAAQGRRPTILFNHWHAGEYDLGKDDLLRAKGGLPSYAEALTSLGYNALCLDMWCFGGRATRSEMDTFKEMLWKGRVMWGMMVYDTLRGLDYLLGRQDVDPERVGTLGMSMGSTMAWWVAALDPRIRACVDICCLTDFEALIATNGLQGHGIYYYVPSLLKHFSTAQINALIAPRPHLALEGTLDPLTPPAGLDRVDRTLRQVYGQLGRPEAWKLLRYEVAHVETPEMRREALAYLQAWLG